MEKEKVDLELGNMYIYQEAVEVLLRSVTWGDDGTNRSSPLIWEVAGCSPFREVTIGLAYIDNSKFEESYHLKNSYLINLMSRIPSPKDEIIKSCVQKVNTSLEQIKACYDVNLFGEAMWRRGSDARIVTWIVRDACFILEFIIKISEYDKSYRGYMLPYQNIIHDLMLIQNQIPFFILDDIFQCTILKFKPNISLVEFILPLLTLLNIFKSDIKINNISSTRTTNHILGLLHECYKPHYPITSTLVTSTIQSTVDLDRAGINIEPNRNPKWLLGMDVKLHRFPCFSWCLGKPTFRMPVLYVHEFTKLVLMNLIKYEHHSSQAHKYVTSYAYTMDMLVNTQEDVAKLVESGVIINNMGSNKEAAKMINCICNDASLEHFFYGEEWLKLNNYCNSYWPQNIARLKRTYFNSPWTIIALFAGIILFALTVVQTVYTIKSARSNKKLTL